MKRSKNFCIFIGPLGADPVQRTGRTSVATFDVATHRTVTTAEGQTEFTDWHHLAAYGRVGEYVLATLKKGMTVYVECEHRPVIRDKPGADGKPLPPIDSFTVLEVYPLERSSKSQPKDRSEPDGDDYSSAAPEPPPPPRPPAPAPQPPRQPQRQPAPPPTPPPPAPPAAPPAAPRAASPPPTGIVDNWDHIPFGKPVSPTESP